MVGLARVGLGIAGLMLGTELFTSFAGRRRKRRLEYLRALSHARKVGRPLLVVGDPDTGYITAQFGRDYGCGDVCTDITGCPKCPRAIKGPLESVLPRLSSSSYVIFVSCTLEYVTDLPLVIRQLERVAVPGGIHVVRVEPGSSTHWMWPGAKWRLWRAPPEGGWDYAPWPPRKNSRVKSPTNVRGP